MIGEYNVNKSINTDKQKECKTVVKVIDLDEEENRIMKEYYREKQLHDEASALGYARKQGRAA